MMISVVKGQRISFAKERPNLRSLILHVYWNSKGSSMPRGKELELDMSAFLLDQTGKCSGDHDIVFYGNTDGRGGGVLHSGKITRGGLSGEGLKIDLPNIPSDVVTVAVTLSIYEGGERRQNFSMIESISTAVLDGITGDEVCRFPIDWHFTVETAIVLCEIYKKNGEWRFNAVGAGYQGGLATLCESFGIAVNEEAQGSGVEPVSQEPPVPQGRSFSPVTPPRPTAVVPPVVVIPPPVAPVPPKVVIPPVAGSIPPTFSPPPQVSIGPPQTGMNAVPPPPPRSANQPLASGNSGVRIGGGRQINLGNPQTRISLDPIANPGNNNPEPRKINLSMAQGGTGMPATPQATASNLPRCRCGAELKMGCKFCTQCGAPVLQQSSPPVSPGTAVQQYCTQCGTAIRDGSKFCTGCGKPV